MIFIISWKNLVISNIEMAEKLGSIHLENSYQGQQVPKTRKNQQTEKTHFVPNPVYF
jgi:hypothetical protein